MSRRRGGCDAHCPRETTTAPTTGGGAAHSLTVSAVLVAGAWQMGGR